MSRYLTATACGIFVAGALFGGALARLLTMTALATSGDSLDIHNSATNENTSSIERAATEDDEFADEDNPEEFIAQEAAAIEQFWRQVDKIRFSRNLSAFAVSMHVDGEAVGRWYKNDFYADKYKQAVYPDMASENIGVTTYTHDSIDIIGTLAGGPHSLRYAMGNRTGGGIGAYGTTFGVITISSASDSVTARIGISAFGFVADAKSPGFQRLFFSPALAEIVARSYTRRTGKVLPADLTETLSGAAWIDAELARIQKSAPDVPD